MTKLVAAAGVLALACAAMLHPRAANAAAITWQQPVNETGNPSDILTSGTFVESAYSYSTTSLTLNGVTFDGYTSLSSGTMTFAGSGVTLSHDGGTPNSYGDAPVGWDATYQLLVKGGVWENLSSPAMTINLAGLSPGQGYAVQILEPFWNDNWATTFSAGGNTSMQVNGSGGDVGAGASAIAQYIIGTFTADASTETIVLGSPTTVAILGALQVRTATIVPAPEPSAVLLLLPGLLGIASLRRRALQA